MERLMYADMAKKLLGDELYLELLTAIAKENNSEDLESYGRKVVEKCCLIIIRLGMSTKVKMDNVKICLGDKIIQIPCKDFARRYCKYAEEIGENLLEEP